MNCIINVFASRRVNTKSIIINITYNLRKVSDPEIFKAQVETMNERISNLTKNVIIDKFLNKKIVKITDKAFKNIQSWQALEDKYKKIKDISKNKYDNIFYKKRVKFFELELKNSLSSLMLILMNLKNIT